MKTKKQSYEELDYMDNIDFCESVTVDMSMEFEQLYPPELQLVFRDKIIIGDLSAEYGQNLWMFLNKELAGECFGMQLDVFLDYENGDDEENFDIFDSIKCIERRDINIEECIYCFSTSILTPYQHHGNGKILKTEWVKRVNEQQRWKYIVGHSTNEAAKKINRQLRSIELKTFDRWCGSDRQACLYLIEI